MTSLQPDPDAMKQSLDIDEWSDLEMEPDASERKPWRAILLAVVLAGLAAWAYFGEPEERIVDLIAWVDSSLDLGIAEPVTVIEPPASQPIASEPVVTNEAVFEPEPVAATAADQPEVEQSAIEQPEIEQPEAGQPMPATDAIAADAEPVADQGIVETQQIEPLEAPVTGLAADEAAEEQAAEDEPEAPLVEPFVTVSEQSGLAQVSLPRDVGSGLPLVWWTSEHTARANADFIPVPEQVVDIAFGDTLTVQLVNDNVPEQPESFYVDIGARQPQGHIERVASIRVDIVDDD